MTQEQDLEDLTLAYTDLLAERDSLRAALEEIRDDMTRLPYKTGEAMREVARQALTSSEKETDDAPTA